FMGSFSSAGEQASESFGDAFYKGLNTISRKSAKYAKQIGSKITSSIFDKKAKVNVSDFVNIFKDIPNEIMQELISSKANINVLQPLLTELREEIVTIGKIGEEAAEEYLEEFVREIRNTGDINAA